MIRLMMRAAEVAMIFGIALLCTGACADDYYPVVEQYELDITFIPEEARIDGRAAIRFDRKADYRDTAVCYLHGEIWVDSIICANERIPIDQKRIPCDYNYSGIATEIRFPLHAAADSDCVTVFYQGPMHASTVASPSNYMRIEDDGVYLRSYGYSLWFPIFLSARQNDYTVDFAPVRIRTPADFRSVFVGEKTGEWFENGRRVSEWTAINISLISVQCVARRFQITSGNGIILHHLPDSLSVTMASRILDFTRKLIAQFGERYRKSIGSETYYIV